MLTLRRVSCMLILALPLLWGCNTNPDAFPCSFGEHGKEWEKRTCTGAQFDRAELRRFNQELGLVCAAGFYSSCCPEATGCSTQPGNCLDLFLCAIPGVGVDPRTQL